MNKLIIALAVASLPPLMAGHGTALAQAQSTPAPLAAPAETIPQAAPSVRGLPDFTGLVERAGPAVVNIRTTQRLPEGRQRGFPFPLPDGLDENDPMFEFFRRFFPPGQTPHRGTPGPGGGQPVPRGVGSGFIVSADGFVLTNHHVVDQADEIFVTLHDDRELRGKLIGSDERTDIAVVKVEAEHLPHLTIGDPNTLKVGEWVVAIGSPFGLNNTVTAGIVSAKSRDTGEYLQFIQTDVAVNPGNSGGPLLNMAGQVVGINSQILSRTGGFMGISLAIPIDEAMQVAQQLRDGGRVIRGRIGVGIADVTRDVAEPLGLPRAAGALVRSVESNGPADKAGLQVGDIIQRFGDRPIEKASDLPRLVGSTKPGTKMDLQVWRRGKEHRLNIVVDELKADQVASAGGAQDGKQPGAPSVNALGLAVSDIPPAQLRELNLKNGVIVDSVQGAAARAGLRQGDVIIAVNNADVTGARQFDELVSGLDRGKTIVALVRRGDSAQFVPIRPEPR